MQDQVGHYRSNAGECTSERANGGGDDYVGEIASTGNWTDDCSDDWADRNADEQAHRAAGDHGEEDAQRVFRGVSIVETRII